MRGTHPQVPFTTSCSPNEGASCDLLCDEVEVFQVQMKNGVFPGELSPPPPPAGTGTPKMFNEGDFLPRTVEGSDEFLRETLCSQAAADENQPLFNEVRSSDRTLHRSNMYRSVLQTTALSTETQTFLHIMTIHLNLI